MGSEMCIRDRTELDASSSALETALCVGASLRAPHTVHVGVPFCATVQVFSRETRPLAATFCAPLPPSEDGARPCGGGSANGGAPAALCLSVSVPLGVMPPGGTAHCTVRLVALTDGLLAMPPMRVELVAPPDSDVNNAARAASSGALEASTRAAAPAVLGRVCVRAGSVRASVGPAKDATSRTPCEGLAADGDGAAAHGTCWEADG